MNLSESTLDERIAAEVARLDGLSKVARREFGRWWVRRRQITQRWPGSLQFRLAHEVVCAMSPASVAAFERAIARRDTAA